MGKLPWFPFWGRDFFGDEKVKLFNLRQIGFYLTLLWHEWEHGSIPTLDECKRFPIVGSEYHTEVIRNYSNGPMDITGLHSELEEVYFSCFVEHPEMKNRYINQKLEAVRVEQNKKEISATERARKGGNAKAAKALLKQDPSTAKGLLNPAIQSQSQNLSYTGPLSLPISKKKSTEKEKRRRDLESFELTDELRNWAMQEFGVSIPDDVFQEFKDHWMKEPDTKLRINWTATFKTRIRQLVSWKTLVPKQQGIVETCMFQEQQVQKNGRLPTYKPCGKPIAENSKKKLCADHIRAEQERLSRKPVLPLLQEETTICQIDQRQR